MAHKHKAEGRAPRLSEQAFRLAPLASAVAWMVTMGSPAQAQTAFSPAWFASKGAVQNSASQTGQLPSGKPAGLPSPTQQSEAARQKLQQSISNLGLTAQAIAAQQARQAAARAAAGAVAAGVPDGLTAGGLVVDTQSLTKGWLGAKAPVQVTDAGKTTVTVAQTDSRAILNWETFNVGRNTTVQFQQQADWAVLNKVNDPLARPSQIQGQVKGDGTVMIVNRNGVIFGGTSQINTRNLVAAAATITDDQFRTGGLNASGNTPTFTGGLGPVQVQAGAQITTTTPASVTVGGGYAMLLGGDVRNDGTITTPSGQTVLAAGETFILRRGAGTDGNAGATTIGSEVATTRTAGAAQGSSLGTVVNTGLITATTGDITLTGHDVTQGGVLVSTTSTSRRGTLHLSTRASDETGRVTLAEGSTSAILLETTDATALDAQRDAALRSLANAPGNQVGGVFDNLSPVVDRKDLSRIEIVSGNTVDVQGRSMTLATGGEIVVSANRRTQLDAGATLDVSGAVGVKVAMESNNLKINAQGNEQRDAVSNRDAGNLNNLDLWVDRRTLVLVPAGTNGFAGDRWYTAGGLLEVSGYVATGGHSVGEWMAQGGTVTVTGGDLVTRSGSRINLSGGSLDVAGGIIRQSWLKGSDGQLHEVSSAPADLLYTGLYQGFADEHARWGSGATQSYFNPLIAPQTRLENGYTVGRDAGRLVVATRSAVLEGTLVGDTFQGPQQTRAPQASLDGYSQSQDAAARGAQLIIGSYRPGYDASSQALRYTLAPTVDTVTLLERTASSADRTRLDDAVPAERQGQVVLDTGALNSTGLGALRVAAQSGIRVGSAVQVADGGDITLLAPAIDVGANLTAHGGSLHLGNVLRQAQLTVGAPVQDNALTPPTGGTAPVVTSVNVRSGVTLDASGRQLDLRDGATDGTRLAFLDGGLVSLRSTGNVTLAAGASINVSSGVALRQDGSITGGSGGSVQLGAGLKGLATDQPAAALQLDGSIRGHGVKGGGTLSIESASGILIGGQSQSTEAVLKAGQTSQLDLILLKEQVVQVAAGRPLPVDYTDIIRWVSPGQLVGPTGISTTVELVLADDWVPPVSVGLRYPMRINGQYAIRSELGIEMSTPNGGVVLDHIPAGSTVRFDGSSDMLAAFAAYVLPGNVFPQGVAIEPRRVVLQAGSPAPKDLTLTLNAGTRLAAGLSLPDDAAVAPVTRLSTDLFQSGFSAYDVRGHLGLVVSPGTSLEVTQPVLRAERSALTAGVDLDAAFTPWTPSLYEQDASAGRFTQRGGASLSLAAGVPAGTVNRQEPSGAYYGSLVIGEGASVRVDPGQSLSLSARHQLQVDGRLAAKGGQMVLQGARDVFSGSSAGQYQVGDGSGESHAIVIGSQAVLDVSASATVATDAMGRQYGQVSQGGRIFLGGTLDSSAGVARASEAFVVVKEGAVLNASGASVDVDLPTGGKRTLASDGGTIELVSSQGVYLDGSAVARSGGGAASGGTLTVALEAASYSKREDIDLRLLAPRELTVSQLAPRGSVGTGTFTTGHGAIGVDQVAAGGFSSLNLYSNGIVSFAGDVDLAMGRELRVYSAGVGMARGSSPNAAVRLSAPYLLLSGVSDTLPLPGDLHLRPVYQGGVTPLPSTASLTAEGRLVDVRGTVTFGVNASVTNIGTLTETRAGFAQVDVLSDGDLRFIGGGRMPSALADAELLSTGSLLLRAGQIYPATGVNARVVAGRTLGDKLDPQARIEVERAHPDAADPALPYSVFGRLSLEAAQVDQNGVLRAPLGNITLGSTRTDSVTLGAGSVTSLSAATLVLPYGGTSDGVSYVVNGEAVKLNGVGAGPLLTIAGEDVVVGKGAVVDLSGGGDLRGAGFVSGRGGSTDARWHPLTQVGKDQFSMPALATNPVYAIVPGYASGYAPMDAGAVDPRIGQQITVGARDIPGLPAGTYTLMPSAYALLPGAFRVELDGVASAGQVSAGAVAMRNGSYAATGTLSTAGTGLSASEPTRLVVTPADVLRRYSQYNETSYSDFIVQQAALNNTVRAVLPSDAKDLILNVASTPKASLQFEGTPNFSPAKDGRGGTASLTTYIRQGNDPARIEVLADEAAATAGFGGLSVRASDLNALQASRLLVGGTMVSTYGAVNGGADRSNYIDLNGAADQVVLRQGALLRAPEVFLMAGREDGGVTIESGAGINTLGTGKVAFDAANGYVWRPGAIAVVAASNGRVDMLAPTAGYSGYGSGPVTIGGCVADCDRSPTQLYSEGSLVVATRGDFQMGDDVRFGTRNLVLAMGAVNAGNAEDLAAAQARGVLTPGLTLNQAVMDRLIQGDRSAGSPALERLVLTAAESFNLFGNVSLNTVDPATGKSSLAELVLTTPALYGQGSGDDVARITTGKFTWAGSSEAAPAPITDGRGSGAGRLVVQADVIELGYGGQAQPTNVEKAGRTILGFSDVALTANSRFTANHQGSLSVYESLVAGDAAPVPQGGNLTVTAPLVTGQGGSVSNVTAGGRLQVLSPTTGGAPAQTGALTDVQTGAELNLSGNSVRVDTAVVLPSGRLTVKADGDVTLGEGARLDLAGREWVMNDVRRFSWGGDVHLDSQHGKVTQAARARIDVSARNNHAGLVAVSALDAAAGQVDLQGQWAGSSSGHYDAGGTLVPYRAGSVDIRARQLGDGDLSAGFAALNERLNAGGLVGGRSFQLREGDLTIGNELKAREVSVSLDRGALTVSGRVDASGEQVGSIRLSAAQGLTVTGSGHLDAHGTVLRVDGRGEVIESPNRASVVLDAGMGTLTLGDGATIDLRHGTGTASSTTGSPTSSSTTAIPANAPQGTLELYAPRVGSNGSVTDADAATYGDIAINARGTVQVQGARSIAVYGRQVYTDAPYGTDAAASGRPYQVVDQAYLDARHAASTQFIDRALAHANLLDTRLAGLNNDTYRNTLHLRPAVEIRSATPDGDLVVRGDVDLSGHRYASLNPTSARTGVYGSGEVGALTLRAGGDLSVYGSINDGFAPPPVTPDDGGWLLTAGVQPFGGDVVVPVGGVTLADGTTYPAGKILNYDVTARDVTLPTGTVLPTPLRLEQAITLTPGTVLAADIRAQDGSVLLAAGTPVGRSGMDVPAGASLMPGARLPMPVTVVQLTWPKGVALPIQLVQQGDQVLPVGALIASGTKVVLPGGAASVALRDADGDGRQGRNWAVASMLPAGSQSWSLSLVAGGDLEAADPRIRQLHSSARLTLADTHYGVQTAAGGVVSRLNATGLDTLMQAVGLPPDISDPGQLLGLTEDQIVALYGAFSWADFGLPMDFWTPAAGNILMGLTAAGADQVYNVAGLAPGMNSVSDLIGKNERELVSLYGAFSWSDFGFPSDFWALGQGNGAVINLPPSVKVKAPAYSVLRTGTGDLTLVSAGDLSMRSAYGVYTAGTPSPLATAAQDARYQQARGAVQGGTVLGTAAGSQAADYERLVSGADSLYQAWYPDHGGKLSVDVGGNLTGDSWAASGTTPWASSSVGNWLWRQGTGGTAGIDAQPTAWWINFGTYAYKDGQNVDGESLYWPTVTGFTGMGTLGGGDVSVRVGGDAGVVARRSTGDVAINSAISPVARSEGLVLAIGSTGRVLEDGTVLQTGGGDLDLRIGGGWNSHVEARLAGSGLPVAQAHELDGALVNLRGSIDVSAGRIGTIEKIYGELDAMESRAGNPGTVQTIRATGGLLLMQGDAAATLNSRSDLVLGGTGDAGVVGTPNVLAFSGDGGSGPAGMSWFSLWTDRTALAMTAAGGPLALDTRASESIAAPRAGDWDYTRNGGWFMLPGQVSAVAPTGSLYYGRSAASGLTNTALPWSDAGLLLAPLGARRIELLAGDSIYGGGYGISVSGASRSIMATPERPAFAGYDANGETVATNVHPAAPVVEHAPQYSVTPVLAFGANTLAPEVATALRTTEPSRFYAINGDIVGLRTGTVVDYLSGGLRSGARDIVAAGPVDIRAGRDLVHTGVLLDQPKPSTAEFSADGQTAATLSGSVVVHSHANDVSRLQAGRDIVYANLDGVGPGLLEITAGRHLIQNDRATLTSAGPGVPTDTRSGASIVVQAGMGTQEPDYSAFARRYLDSANQATPGRPLADQPGKVVKLYRDELVQWLGERFDFKGSADDAVKFYATLAAEQQRIFARQVFFAELREGGREFNDAKGVRYGSYLRGRNAIAAMFPGKENGPGADTGNLLMYGGAGIHTNAGGDIQVLTPSGAQTYGIEGAAPPATAGLITRGIGDIQLYSLGSVLLGQSRVMTTFGGDILAWSAKGDINAGRGAKTTLVFTPPRRVYDPVGNVRLSPDVPSTGAGIATLNPLPEVKPGDVDLIAPLGTVDAGEAGIRVSGNINIAALRILNAANIQVKGQSVGLPTVAAVNVTALTNASTAAATAVNAAQEVVQRDREATRQQLPSVFTVRVLGLGDEAAAPAAPPPGPTSRLSPAYDPKSPVQVLGHGVVLDPVLMAQLTEEERRALQRLR